jgi:hypothetical protein
MDRPDIRFVASSGRVKLAGVNPGLDRLSIGKEPTLRGSCDEV